MKLKRSWIVVVVTLIIGIGNVQAKGLHVTVDGVTRASGDIDSPMSLEWAFASLNRAGDTILIHGGDYYGNFNCWASGDENNPLVIMPYNNEVVRIIGTGSSENTLSLNGNWCVVRDLIITQTQRDRVSISNHSWPDDVNTEQGVTLVGRGLKFINNIIHDVYSNGILGSGSNGVDAEVSGNIIFNTGWIGSENGHGHGMYLQNNEGTKKTRKNIIFNTYGHGIQFYTTGGQQLNGINIEQNIVFNAGAPAVESGLGSMRNMMLGGDAAVDNLVVRENYSYMADNSTGTGMQVGYNSISESCRIEENYIAGGNKVFVFYRFKSGVIQNNTIIGDSNELLNSVYFPADVSIRGEYNWNLNSYYADEEKFFDANNNKTLDFEGWQNQVDVDENSNLKTASAKPNMATVIPNDYQEGRGHVVVYNWENRDEVSVDLGDVLTRGETYTVYDVENIFEPLVTGTYNGSGVSIPMNSSKIIQPAGNGVYPISHTSSEFGVFLVTKTTSASRVPTSTVETSVDQQSQEMRVYPNPSSTFFNCDFVAENSGLASIQLIDLSGRSVISREQSIFRGENKIVLDVSGLNEGIYILSVSYDGKTKTTKVKVY